MVNHNDAIYFVFFVFLIYGIKILLNYTIKAKAKAMYNITKYHNQKSCKINNTDRKECEEWFD